MARVSRRRRRLRWTIATLTFLAVAGSGAAVWLFLRSRPAVYQPGEDHPEITQNLVKDLPAEAPRPRFTDVTKQAGLVSFRAFAGARTSQLPEDMGSGAAWGDFDNDGDQDLFLVSSGGPLTAAPAERASSELYENLGDGTFRKVADFPDTRVIGMGAAWGDYDSDGRLDLVVTGYNTLILYHNEGGRFSRDTRFPEPKGFWAGAAWGDFDNDRDLDLYVCGYVRYVADDAGRARASQQYGYTVPFTLNPASYKPERNLLFRNNGDATFTEVAEALRVSNPEGRSLSALWHDFDDDGWLDLYIANDISDNVLYRNRGGKFEDISHPAWVADYRGAMGLTAGDWNGDGDDDLYITHWIAQENALYDNLTADLRKHPPVSPPGGAQAATPLPAMGTAPAEPTAAGSGGMAQAAPAGGAPAGAQAAPAVTGSTPPAPGSAAAAKYAGMRFMDNADAAGVGYIALQFVGWGTEFADFDADGWLDLAVANGSTFETEDVPKRLRAQEPFLFWNQSGRHFFNRAPLSDTLAAPRAARGLALADYDNDGDLDILMVIHDGGVLLLRNDMQTGHWLEVRLRSRAGKKRDPIGFGDGAALVARAGSLELRRTVTSASYLSQSSRVVHFGLGEARAAERLEVRWLGGAPASYSNLEAGSVWELTEGDPNPRRLSSGSAVPAGTAAGAAQGAGGAVVGAAAMPDGKARIIAFWDKERGAMHALKGENDIPKAIGLFREALALDPQHEDSRYYLGNCLAIQGDLDGALAQFEELTKLNPQSHRGYKRWGTLKAMFAASPADFDAAEAALEKALAINPEETGSLMVLGEIALLRGQADRAEQRLAWACRTNPKAVGAFFLRGYLAWKQEDASRAGDMLAAARRALGKDWKPTGGTAEGDVLKKLHTDATPLSGFWEGWDGSPDPAMAFTSLDTRLRAKNVSGRR